MPNRPSDGLVLVAGADPDTANLGVSALAFSTLHGLRQRCPGVRLGVFDGGNGIRWRQLRIGDEQCDVAFVGLRIGRRYDLASNATRVRAAIRWPFLPNAVARAIRRARAILDVSGGDSFTDLYGPRRFHSVATTKRIALEAGVPLILLPQTYGPFRDERCRAEAAALCRQATVAWAREPRSFEVLRSLLGSAFSPDRHHEGVDVAFLLPAVDPGSLLPDPIRSALEARTRPIAGFNVSGLIYNDPDAARDQYGFQANYRDACRDIVEALAADGAQVLLVPHVGAPDSHVESDPRAIQSLLSMLSTHARARTAVVPFLGDPQLAKWVIAQCDWFCGMRMHATIAGLSSGVPTAAISYSPKTLGVFETCGSGDSVADPTRLDTTGVVRHILDCWRSRDHRRADAALAGRKVREIARGQMDQIVHTCFATSSLSPQVA